MLTSEPWTPKRVVVELMEDLDREGFGKLDAEAHPIRAAHAEALEALPDPSGLGGVGVGWDCGYRELAMVALSSLALHMGEEGELPGVFWALLGEMAGDLTDSDLVSWSRRCLWAPRLLDEAMSASLGDNLTDAYRNAYELGVTTVARAFRGFAMRFDSCSASEMLLAG